ncbi:CHAD domain-containing protein [Granulicella sp. dw_53]|uniref:CHAD domain-containing protein n=1 Tax=Granulicella sp. dw_53 TaxID=2719792 RepID=UPI001BD6D431|nr:CHAD domain-containing protein [Granulicella sp. dw_53]
MANATISRPIQALRGYVTSLEAAVTLCLADPQPKAVHILRTTSRRIEAQLTLLSLLPNLPSYVEAAEKVQRRLRKIRRAAGQVRDFDVQIDLVSEQTNAGTKKDSRELRKVLKHRRREAADELVELLEGQQAKLTRSLESLVKALEPAEDLSLSATQLSGLVREWFAGRLAEGTAPDDPEWMHDLRKTAKAARYIAETAPSAARTLRKLAKHFESLQHSGGEWHDWMVLAEVAHEQLGRSSALTQAFCRRSRSAMTSYRARVDSIRADSISS